MGWDEVSIIDLESKVSQEILARGQEYQQTGHILRACRLDGILAGEAAGTGGTYRIRLTIGETGIDGGCTCPYPGFCKHMVALTLAWIEKSVKFIALDQDLNEIIENPESFRDVFAQLIRKDPLNFLDLTATSDPEGLFLNSRGVLNLIRNTFQAPSLTHRQIETHWERIKRIQELVARAVNQRRDGAPALFMEFLKGVAYSFRHYQAVLLKKVFDELLLLWDNLPEGWMGEETITFVDTLYEIYLDDRLWELADSVRPVLVKLYPKFPSWFQGKLKTVEWQSLGQPELTLLYQLLVLIAKNGQAETEYFKKTIEVLNKTPEGQLWLIDRIMGDDPDRSFTLAKQGLRNCNTEYKRIFRERIIEIHLIRGENKQAAALSFIQFLEGPNLEGYLRLKDILAGHRSELLNYLDKMDKAIVERGLPILAARIAFDQGDWEKLKEELEKIEPSEVFLKELAGLVIADAKSVPLEIFQAIITRLLMGGRSNWEITLGLLVNCKKICLKNSWNEEWSKLRVRLNTEYGEDQRFIRKFGAVLAG